MSTWEREPVEPSETVVIPPPAADAEPAIAEAPPKVRKAKSAPKWETDTRDRLRSTVRKMAKPLADLVARDANEGDTRLWVTDMLCYGLGYDKYEDLTTEYQVKGEFADYGVRLDKQVVAFIEVKRCTTKLGEKHLRQVQMYAVNEGVEWLILTNGAVWQVYHLTGGLPVVTDLVFEVDLLDDETPLADKVHALFHLTKESFKRRQIDDLWQQTLATAPATLVGALLSDAVLDALRKELRRTTGLNPNVADIRAALETSVLRNDVQ